MTDSKTSNTPEQQLPPGFAEWIRRSTGAEVASYRRVAGGGASRQGAILAIRYPDGATRDCFLTFDLRDAKASERLSGITAEATAIRAVGQHSQMKVAEVLAWDDDLRAMLASLEPGDSNYIALTDEVEKLRLGEEFMVQLASLHSADIAKMDLQSFPPPLPPSIAIRERLAALKAKYEAVPPDPLLTFTLKWLEDNIPDDPQRIVLVHGDAGPANFLFHEGRISAVLDWEMTHFGDPVEDVAWIAIRMLLQPFPPIPHCIEVYEGAGGTGVDVQKVRYYIVYNIINLAVDSYIDLRWGTGESTGVWGDILMFNTLHRRALVEVIAAYLGCRLEPLSLPPPRPSEEARGYAVALNDLRQNVLPVVSDPVAASRLRAMTRQLKYWGQKAVLGAAFDEMEKAELEVAFQTSFGDTQEARAAFSRALQLGSLPSTEALPLLYRRVMRETELMRPAMGRLAGVQLPPLTV